MGGRREQRERRLLARLLDDAQDEVLGFGTLYEMHDLALLAQALAARGVLAPQALAGDQVTKVLAAPDLATALERLAKGERI